MVARLARLALRTLPLASTWLLACSSASGGGAGGSATTTDGKFHPPSSGVAMSETDACKTLSTAQTNDSLALSCLSTGYSCPDLLRAQFSTACLQYDQGSVQGCVAYYAAAKSCDALAAAIDTCAVAPIVGSAPNGC